MSDAVYETIEKSWLRLKVEAASSHATRLVAAYYGDKIPIYCVSEYPRSGGTWLSSMMADYLRCAKPTATLFPIGCRSVVHNHWPFHKRLNRTVYLVRDGRDVMTSLYFFVMRSYKSSLAGGSRPSQMDRRVKTVFGGQFDPDDIRTNLAKFLAAEFERPFASGSINWPQHVDSWISNLARSKVLVLKYEDLLLDRVGILRKAVEHVSPVSADERLLQRSADHFEMASITGRRQGEEDKESFVRKGIAGDWTNCFDKSAAEVFAAHAGEALVLAGYETGSSWVDSIGGATS